MGQIETPSVESPPLPETRAVRIPFGSRPDAVAAEITRAADAGFNVVVVQAFARGFPSFPSHVSVAAGFPRLHPELRGVDYVGAACTAARRRGVALYVSISCLNAGLAALGPTSPFLRRHSDFLLRSRPRRWLGARTWSPEPPSQDVARSLWLCPASAEIRRLFAGLATELAASYPIDGVLLDDLAYPPVTCGDNFCGCSTCVDRVAGELGIHLTRHWPEPGTEAHDILNRWRVERLTEFVTAVKARARKGRRNVRVIGLAGRRNHLPAHDPTQLAAGEWRRAGLLDIFCHREPDMETVCEQSRTDSTRPIPTEDTPGLQWEEVVVTAGGEWPWTGKRRPEHGGLLIRWDGTPSPEDWEQAGEHLPNRVPALESSPLPNALLLLKQAAALGAVGCIEAAELTAGVAERDHPGEPVGGRLDRLLVLSDALERLRSTPAFAEGTSPASPQASAALAHITDAAGLVKLSILTV